MGKITVIILIITVFCGFLTGCGEQNKIKKSCEEKAEDILSEASAKVFSQSLATSAYELYRDKTSVSYDKDNNNFTCHVYAVISTMTLNSTKPSTMHEHFTILGYVDKSEVVITYIDANQISQTQLPK